MKKLYTLLALGLSSVASFADSAVTAYTPNTSATGIGVEAVAGTGGILEKIADFIATCADKAWPIILAVVGIGLMIWLGRAMIRAVRAYFSTAM